MFETLLNSILEKTLGQYIEGLKKDDLEVSVWSGDVELNNVKIKKDIFQTFGLPLELIYGQIGRLKICVPWKNIGSKPVNLEIENVVIVVRPITDQTMWKSSESTDTDAYLKKRDLINKFAHKLYTDLMKTKEELAKEAGILNSMVTKILDNLEVALRNIHIRIENEDPNDQDATFSIGITLQSVDLYTTDVNLKKTYVDRSLPKNADLPIHKLLNLKNFGIYYKIRETVFVQHQEKDADRLKAMQDISSRTEPSGKFTDYADAYLLDPIQLEVKLNQFDPKQALEKLESLITLNIKLASVGICLQKAQYDNLQQLLELTNSFMRFLNTAGLRQTKIYWQQMQDILQQKNIVVIKKNVKDFYQKIFTTQIAILIKIGVDEKKSVQLQKELNADLERQKLTLEYERVLLAIDYYELETWAKEVCTKKSEFDIDERAIQARLQGKGFLSSIFGKPKQAEAPKEEEKKEVVHSFTPKAETPKAAMFLSKFQTQLVTSVSQGLKEIETARDRIKNAIPKIKVNFYLDKFRVSLIDKDGFGIQWYSDGFKVELKMYDGSNKFNSKTMEVQVTNQAFGVVSIGQGKQDIPFIQQLSAVTDQPACDIILKLGNVNHHESDLPKEAIDETDLELKVKVLPIEIIYQATPIGRLSKFFKVKHLDERTKLQAQDQFNQLQSQVNSISKSIEADFRNNKINIEVDAPCLVLPFKQETLEEVTSSQCWIYQMGDFSFKDTTRPDIDSGYHECFELKVQRVRFEYSDHYDKWKNHQLETVKILSEFSLSILLVRKRDMDEMRTLQNKQFLRQLRSPTYEVIAGFDTELQLSLKPNIFIKMTQIGTLLKAAEQPEEYWIKKKQKRLESSSFRSEVKKQNNYYQWDKGMACLVSPRWLYFFDDASVTSHYYFDLNGCSVQDGLLLEGQEITLKNRSNEICKLQCPSVKIADKWHEKLKKAASDVDALKKNYDEKQTSLQTDFDDPDTDLDKETVETVVTTKFNEPTKTEDDETEVESFDQIIFGLKFTAPSLQLHLVTEKVNQQASVRQSSQQFVYWELATRVEQLSVNIEQYKFHMDVQAKVASLRVSDNCGDTRFPVIFENQAVEHQNDLLTLKVSKIQKESPHYFDCDTEISIGIGGLKIFWKPSSLILLFRFMELKKEEKTIRENLATAMQDKVKSKMLMFIEKDIGHEVTSEAHLSTVLEHDREDWKQQATIRPLLKQGTISDKGVQKLIKNCQQKPESQIKVDLQLAFLSFVCIHPQNTSYPIFSVDLKNLGLEYTKKCDCDQIKLTVTNLQIIDSTNYPKTLNPERDYEAGEPLIQKEILGVNFVDGKQPQMLDLQVTIFTYPETGSCPLQVSKDFNMNVAVNMRQLKVIFMNEQLMRMIDYINYQIVLVISPGDQGDPNEEKVQDSHLSVKRPPNAKSYLLWSKFDLKQVCQGPGLDIKIQSPFVIIPDLRSDGTQQFDLDFGKITIVSKIQQEKGYWNYVPEKELFTSSYLIKTNNIRFDFNQLGQRKKIFNNEKLDINFKMPNWSPFFNEEEPVYTGIPQAPVFDLSQIDSSQSIEISLGFMKMDLPQHVTNKIFDIMNNNFFMNDKYKVHFEETLRSKADKAPEKLTTKESKQDRKLMQLSITASVLSLDFRDDQNGLICDITIVGMKYDLETYLSGRQSMSLTAGSLFIFFDEYIESNLKEMLMGHINTPQFVVTDKAFYQDLPLTLLQTGKHKFKFTMDVASNGDSDMYLEMLQLKLWVRTQVFIDLSRYLVQALGRLSIETTLAEQVPVVVSSAVQKMKIHLDESLIIIKNDEISDKCIVLQVAMDLLMISKDPESIKQSGEKITSTNFYSVTIAIKNVAGYLCDLEELTEVSFKEAKKREFIQPSSCKIDLNSSLVTNSEIGLYTENLTEIVMNEADLKISIDDLQVLNSIVSVLMAEIFVLSAIWADYSNPPVKPKLIEVKEGRKTLQDKMQVKLLQNLEKKLLEIKEEKPILPNLNTMRVYLEQAKVLIINESKDFYVPLFMLRCQSVVYAFSPINFKEDQSKGTVSTDVHLSYYNSDAGFFEPAIDRFQIYVGMEYLGKSSITKINLADPININFTIGFADCVTQFNKIYTIAQDKATSYQQKAQDLKKGISTINAPKLGIQRTMQTQKSNLLQRALTPMGRERKLTVKQSLEKLSSPFAVRNMTDKPIIILQVDRAGKVIMNQQESTVVQPDEIAKLVLGKGQISLDGSQSENFIRIEFTGEGMIPLKRVNLNQNNYFTKHSVFGKLEKSREFYVITSKMEESRKVLTVRTQHVLTNQTKISYHVKIFYVEKDKIIDIKVTVLDPGQSTPLQDFGSASQHQNVKISIRPKKHKKWGAEYKFVPLKEKMIPDENTEWPHLPTYTIIRKIKMPLDGVFDYALIPPMILQNCLPCPIKLQIEEEFKEKIEVKPQDAQGVKPTSQIVILDKEDEKHIYDIKNRLFVKHLLLKFDLGNQFATSLLTISPLQSKDVTLPIKITDTQNRSFNLQCKVETTDAGLKLILYCENMLICHTQQRLSFFYHKKAGVGKQENAHVMPYPVVGSAESDSLVYIFDDHKALRCLLADNNTSEISTKLHIKTIGHVGDFSVTSTDSMRQYNFGYSVNLYLSGKSFCLSSVAKNSDIPMTKIVEVAPQFIILNKTETTLMFKQEQEAYTTHHELAPGKRTCYNWEDKSKPQLFTFKPADAEFTFCAPFNLKDCGTTHTCSVSQGKKTYYRILKRQVDQSIFAVIEQSEAPYLIVNKLQEIDLRICQNNLTGNDLYDNVTAQQQSPFAWQDVNAANKLLEVEFRLQNQIMIPEADSKHKKNKTETKKISIDGINQTTKIDLNHPVTKARITVIVSVYKGAQSKVIEFSYLASKEIIDADVKREVSAIEEEGKEQPEEEGKEQVEEDLDDFFIVSREQKQIRPKIEGKDKTQIHVDLNQLTVSLIMNNHEYMNIVLRTLRLQKINTDSDLIIYCTLDRIQIDNCYEADPIFPVVIRPKCVAGDLEHDHINMQNVDHVFGFYAHKKLNVPNVTFFSTIEFLLRELEIKIEFDYIMKLVTYIKVVQQKLAVGFYNQHQIFKPKEKQEQFVDYYSHNMAQKAKQEQLLTSNWREKTIEAQDEQVTYIQRYVGSSMCFEITLFKQTGTQEQNADKEKGSIGLSMAASGLKLTNLNGAPIKLEALQINDVYGHDSEIETQFLTHYLSNMKYNILRVAGSSDLIGNPYNFVNNLGSGMKKYYQNPREQIMKGPKEAVMAGVSLFTGSAGMAAHTAASASGYLGRITGSLNRAIVAGSFDREYIHKKEVRDIKEKPKSTLDGLGKGALGLGTSVLSGVTGLVVQPYQGSKKGAMGLVKGVGLGIAGLFTKPASGVVDLVSKTTQGIENGVTGLAECKQSNERLRKPRAFYLALNIVKEYSELDSDVYSHLRSKISKRSDFWACYVCGVSVKQGQKEAGKTNDIMLLTSDFLYALSSDMKIVWQCPVTSILEISLDAKQGLIIRGKEDLKKGNRFQFPEVGTQLIECVQILDDIKYASSIEDLAWVLH